MVNKNIPKIGLALGSGGAKGLAHIGVIKVLAENNIPIDFIAGSSIGAVIGAYYAAYRNVSKLEKMALSTNWQTGFRLFFDPTLRGGFIKGEKIEKLLKIWFKDIKFSDLKIPFIAIATDLITGQEVNINRGNIVEAIRASLSVPAVFKPIKHNKRLLADGGLSNPLPDDIVRRMGADIVIAVNLDNKYFGNEFKGNQLSVLDVSIRALNIMRYYLAKNCSRTADMVLEPKINGKIGLIGWNQFFDAKKTRQIIQSGIEVANKFLPEIKKLIIPKLYKL